MKPLNNGQFLLMNYTLGENRPICKIGDEVIIHPVIGRSQATKSYPAKISVNKNHNVLTVVGIRENSGWYGAWINDYAFSRLEFVKRDKI